MCSVELEKLYKNIKIIIGLLKNKKEILKCISHPVEEQVYFEILYFSWLHHLISLVDFITYEIISKKENINVSKKCKNCNKVERLTSNDIALLLKERGKNEVYKPFKLICKIIKSGNYRKYNNYFKHQGLPFITLNDWGKDIRISLGLNFRSIIQGVRKCDEYDLGLYGKLIEKMESDQIEIVDNVNKILPKYDILELEL